MDVVLGGVVHRGIIVGGVFVRLIVSVVFIVIFIAIVIVIVGGRSRIVDAAADQAGATEVGDFILGQRRDADV